MKKDTEVWLRYAEENISSAKVLLESELYNPSLQNAQQGVEKFMKAVLIEKSAGLTRTHSIRELANRLEECAVKHGLSDDDIDLLDSIYLPSKYPVMSVLPYFMPDRQVCLQCIQIVEAVRDSVIKAIESSLLDVT